MSSWTLKSIPPHDWFLCLDIASYFDHEHNPEQMFEEGFTRPIPLNERDIIATIFFNGDPEAPEFNIESPEALTKEEISQANKSISKILGTTMDIRPLYDQAASDPFLKDKLNNLYGLKRMTRANLFEDIQNRIVEMQINHKPTAKKMMFKMREAYGAMLVHNGKNLPAWPRPSQLMYAEPAHIRKLGPTVRKGEYLVDLAAQIVNGSFDMDFASSAGPREAYDALISVRGIGPSAAQDLIMMRGRPDAIFPSNKKKGEETSIRRWIAYNYGRNPNTLSDKEFYTMIKSWEGYEAAALEFLFVDWVLTEKERKARQKNNPA